MPTSFEQFKHAHLRLFEAHRPVMDDRLGDLPPDRIERIERGHRLLEDHGDLGAAHLVEALERQSDQLLAAIFGRAGDAAIVGQQAHDTHHGLALAGTGFADDRKRFTRL